MTLTWKHQGLIPISYRMFVFEPKTVDDVDIGTRYGAGMLHAKRDALGVSSAVEFYPSMAALTVELHDTEPPQQQLDEWDAAAEISYQFDQPAYPNETLNMYPAPLADDLESVELPPGQYRVRAYGLKTSAQRRPRPQKDIDKFLDLDDNDNLITSDALEAILVQFWFDDFDPTNIPRSIEIKKHEEYVQW